MGARPDPTTTGHPGHEKPRHGAGLLREHSEAAVGIEGLVIKGLGTRYHPGRPPSVAIAASKTAQART